MQKTTTRKPMRSKFTLLRQLCNLIPDHLVTSLAREHGAEEKVALEKGLPHRDGHHHVEQCPHRAEDP